MSRFFYDATWVSVSQMIQAVSRSFLLSGNIYTALTAHSREVDDQEALKEVLLPETNGTHYVLLHK